MTEALIAISCASVAHRGGFELAPTNPRLGHGVAELKVAALPVL